MKPTELLSQEHKIILKVLDVAEREAAQMQKSGRANAWTIEKMLDFFQNFVDKCHHAKEERYLFIKMEERGIPRAGGPLGQMLRKTKEKDQKRDDDDPATHAKDPADDPARDTDDNE